MNFKAVLALPKTARSAKTHKNISFISIVWSTLYMYIYLWIQLWKSEVSSQSNCKLLEILQTHQKNYFGSTLVANKDLYLLFTSLNCFQAIWQSCFLGRRSQRKSMGILVLYGFILFYSYVENFYLLKIHLNLFEISNQVLKFKNLF